MAAFESRISSQRNSYELMQINFGGRPSFDGDRRRAKFPGCSASVFSL
jgi:hypothetical protein